MEGEQESERPVNVINNDDVKNFIASNPSSEDLDDLSKHELRLLATYYQLDLPAGSNRLPLLIALREVMFGIHNPYLDEDQQEEERPRQPSPTIDVHSEVVTPTLSASEYLKLKELELRLTQERKEMALVEVEQEKIKLEREKLNTGAFTNSNPLQQSSLCKNFSDRIKVIPPFNENDVLEFFNAFEKTAMGLEWPKKEWSVIAQTSFKGKARKVYDNFTFSQCSDYEYMKSEILKAYTLTPEA